MRDSRHGFSLSSWERFVELLDAFPSLRDYKSEGDWDAIAFAKWAKSLSSGGRNAALFVLYIWDPGTDWKEVAGLENYGLGRFDLAKMIGNWDQAHQVAFVGWATDPFWM